MYPSQHLRLKPQIRPLTTAHLAQTMTLLELSAGELEQKIDAELSRNPALEVRDLRRCSVCGQPLINSNQCPRCHPSNDRGISEPIVFVTPIREISSPRHADQDDFIDENIFQSTEDLPTYVLRQIAAELRPEDRLIAAFILSNLDDDGLLEIPLVEVAQYHHVLLSRVTSVLHLIQHADPLGVGSPTPQEALLVQLEILGENHPVPQFADRAIREGLSLISRHQNPELSRLLGIPVRETEEIVQFITDNLNPFPGRAAWGDIRHGRSQPEPVYTKSDVIISGDATQPDTHLVVEVFSPYAGMLQVNSLFRQALQQAPEEKIDQWKSDLEQAELLVKCLQQRNTTIVRLMTRLAVLQKSFILHGDIHLEPLTRASLAIELQVHESTISRAVSSKTVQLPNGRIVPLSKFFDRSLNIRTVLKQIIEEESKPLSDNEIVDVLRCKGFNVARRTVAKYRAMEGILPSHLRGVTTAQALN